MNTTKKKKILWIALVALLVIVSTVGVVSARYVSNYRKEAEIHATNFHFSSDYLAYMPEGANAPEYTVSSWGKESIQFCLYNYEVENIAQISDSDICYELSLSDPGNWEVAVYDQQNAPVAHEGDLYTMEQSDTKSYHRVCLTYKGSSNEAPAPVTVTVNSTMPYSKTLAAEFTANTKKGLEYTVEDKGNYTVLTISTNQYYGTINVTWKPATHSPDNTNESMLFWRDTNVTENGTVSGSISGREYTTYTLVFIRNTTNDSTRDDFNVSKPTGA